jgi:hypothetical protein
MHVMGDLAFFTLVWPYDARRPLVWEAGADGWFWIHFVQALAFTPLAILALARLATSDAGRVPATDAAAQRRRPMLSPGRRGDVGQPS